MPLRVPFVLVYLAARTRWAVYILRAQFGL